MAKRDFAWIGFLVVSFSACMIMAQVQKEHGERTAPYFLMVTSLDPPLSKLTNEQVELLNDTPFDGVAISIFGIYDGGPLPEEAALLKRCDELRKISKKTIWPRVYLNRLVGFLPKVSPRAACTNPEYFDRIKGFDLWDQVGARTDFLALWRLSLCAAKALGAPGVVADFESYNCGSLGNPITLSEVTGRSQTETQAALRDLGARLANIAAEEYPESVLWSLFIGFGRLDWYWNKGRDKPLPVLHAYVFEGMLQQAKKRSVPLKLVSGGEDEIGYYSLSPKVLRQKISARSKAYQSWQSRYGKRLVMGGTITVWNDDTKLTDWARKAAGPAPPFKCFADFKPLLTELFRSYPYFWFYVPMVTDYNPFDPKTAPGLNAKLRETIEAALAQGRK